MSHPLPQSLTAMPSLTAAHAALRAACDDVADFAVDLDRERRPLDALGTDPAFEGVRQRTRAIERTAREISEKLDYLAQCCSNLTEDMARLEVGD